MTDGPDHSWRAHLKATIVLGLPLVASHVAQMLVHLTDTVMVGWYGVTELAAVVLASSVFFVFFIVGSGFAFAVMPMAANAEGAGDQRQVRRVVRMGLWISAIYCVLLTPLLWHFEALLLAIGQKPDISAYAQDYMRIAMWGLVPSMLIMVLKSFVSALERPGFILWGTVVGAVANALLNWAFIFGNWGAPELGIQGAAIASVGSNLTIFLVVAVYCQTHRALRPYQIFTRIWRPDWPAFAEVFRLGWPIGATMLAEVGLFSTAAVMMGWIGTVELATHGIAIQIASMSFMIYLGLSNVATIRGGRALGRGDAEGIRRSAFVVTALQLSVAGFTIVLFLAMPDMLIGLFLDRHDPQAPAIIAYGRGLLILAAAFQIFDGLQVVYLAVLRGLKDTRIPMICALVSYWVVGIPTSYVLAFGVDYGGYGIWAGLVLGLICASVSLIWRTRVVIRRMAPALTLSA
jgi:MATE family multidrug resistance protein